VPAKLGSESDAVDLQVLCLNGAGCRLECSALSMGWEVCRMVSKQLPPKKGGKLSITLIRNYD